MRVLEAQLIEICDIYLGRLYSELDLTVILLALFVVLSQLDLWKNFNIIDGLLDAVVNDCPLTVCLSEYEDIYFLFVWPDCRLYGTVWSILCGRLLGGLLGTAVGGLTT